VKASVGDRSNFGPLPLVRDLKGEEHVGAPPSCSSFRSAFNGRGNVSAWVETCRDGAYRPFSIVLVPSSIAFPTDQQNEHDHDDEDEHDPSIATRFDRQRSTIKGSSTSTITSTIGEEMKPPN
jgi:hypothetical protein